MADNAQKRNTAVFLGVLALAWGCNLFTRSTAPFVATVTFCLNFALYAGLLLSWLQSVRARLLPTRPRAYIVAAVLLMLSYLLLRVVKFRVVLNAPLLSRCAVYAYWTPQTLIPTLFLMLCLRIRRGESARRAPDERLLLIPACALALLALTNDWHTLVYRPRIALADFALATGTYSHGPGFYLLYVWMILTAAAGLLLLLLETGKRSIREIAPLLALVGLWFALVELCTRVIEPNNLPRPFYVPDIHIFSMLGFLEICIRRRLIPYNENYTGFFSALDLPVLTGGSLVDAGRFVRQLCERGEAQGDSILVRTEEGAVWLFTQKQLTAGGKRYDQLTAVDVTERYRIIDELREKNGRLQDIQRRMRAVSDRSADMFVAQEEAAARAALHNQLGQVLLMGRHCLQHPESTDAAVVYMTTAQMNAFLLGEAEEPEPRQADALQNALLLARSIGVTVTLHGAPPEDAARRELLALAIRECAANAVKHAEADTLDVTLSLCHPERSAAESKDLTVTIVNNGLPPKGPIAESGGLLALRRRVEAAGGRMKVQSAPVFRLTLTLA